MNETNEQAPYRPRVLVVDDVPANLDVLVEHFQNDNIELAVAVSGLDALRLAQHTPPDLILLDVMMPDMSGYDVCRQLKDDPLTRDVPVIFLTAMSDAVDEEKGLALGAVDYITKPFVLPVLKARVRNHLELKRKTDLLAELVHLDGLTGIANRRRFDSQLEHEWNRCARFHHPLSVLMIDVDHFKLYNDCYGHGRGDDSLRAVASALQQTLRRSNDLLARYGGEEFAVLLAEVNQTEAARLAEQLRQRVESLALPHAASPVIPQVTISVGVACVVPQLGYQPRQLVEQADRQLYLAKARGRNQVSVDARVISV